MGSSSFFVIRNGMRLAPRLTSATKFTSVSVSSVALMSNRGIENSLHKREPVIVGRPSGPLGHRPALDLVDMPVRPRIGLAADEVTCIVEPDREAVVVVGDAVGLSFEDFRHLDREDSIRAGAETIEREPVELSRLDHL